MKQVDFSTSGAQASSPFGKIQAQLQQAMKSGSAKAQDMLAQMLSKTLSNHFTLVRNLVLPGEPKVVIPCVLVGPACLVVFNPTDSEGFFRAKEDTWYEMEKNSQNYRTASRNLIQETQTMSNHLDELMQAGGQPYPEIQEVLFCANTGMRVESIRPSVRILQVDALDRYAGSLLQETPLLDARQVQGLVEWITTGAQALEEAKPKPEPEKPANSPSSAAVSGAVSGVEGLIRKARLTRQQWTILGALLGAQILLLICLILVVVFTM